MFSPLIYSVLFVVVSTVSALLGITMVRRQRNSATKIFLAISMCLSIWAFGFSVAVSAPTMEVCLLWRRISALGWGLLFALNLHFALILTGYPHFNRKWTPLLYIPAALIVYVFSISDAMTRQQYRFVLQSGGWTNIAVNNGWDFFFYAYLTLYSLLMLLLIFRWRRTATGNARRQASILLHSVGTAVFFGTLTDIVNNSVLLLDIPQVAPIAFLIPLLGISYSMRKYSFLTNGTNDEETILTDASRRKIIDFLGISFIVGGALYVVTQHYIEKVTGFSGFILCGVLLAVGVALLALRRTKIKTKTVETLFLPTAILTIPAISVHFIQYGSITVWAVPFIFVIASVLFNSSALLIGTSISVLLTQALVWSKDADVHVIVSESDYLTRMVIFGLCIWVAFYVNSVYVQRLKENAVRNRYQKLVSATSTQMIAIDEENRDDTIYGLLQQICCCYKGDMVCLCLFDGGDLSMTDQYVYRAGNDVSALPALPTEARSALFDHVLTSAIMTEDVAGMDPIFSPLLSYFGNVAVQSFLSLPLHLKDERTGFLAITRETETGCWDQDQLDTLGVIANTVSDSLWKLSAQHDIRFMAYHDYLTRLPNRQLFSDRMGQAIELAKRTGTLLGVIFLDLDSFKSINDTLGHTIGDELIREIARQLTEIVRAHDTVSRFGGDEFLIMLQNLSRQSDITRVADAMMALFDKPFLLKGQEIFITASAGIAVYPADGEDTETLVKNADIAMYSAKDMGKNGYLFCSEDMKEDVQYKAALTNFLYRALERNELCVYYQPQIGLQDNRIMGAEALLRWLHPTLGMISPGAFIPLAEKTGLINSIGEWALKETCERMQQWQEKGLPRVRVAVNISVNQLRNPLFVEQLRAILSQYAVDPQYLELEVTESVAIADPSYIVPVLNSLKQLGVQISIDDFGTQYSSLSRLKQLPVDRIKIDMQFVQGIDKNEKDKAISKIIINLAKSLGMRVVAEGVETREQLDFLSQRMCDEVQGHYFYKPMPAAEFEQTLCAGLHVPERCASDGA